MSNTEKQYRNEERASTWLTRALGVTCSDCGHQISNHKSTSDQYATETALHEATCKIRKWDKRFMDLAQLNSTWSEDRSRQFGAVIVDDRNVVLGMGWNGFPRGVDSTIDARHERPIKYLFTEHSERNAIYNCAATGTKTDGARIYVTWYPCASPAFASVGRALSVW